MCSICSGRIVIQIYNERVKLLNIFNRRELYMTMDITKCNEVINLLNKEELKYITKTKNSTYMHGKVESIFLNNKGLFLYYIYVHKDDLFDNIHFVQLFLP